MITDSYITYIRTVRRYSDRTIAIYADVLREFVNSCCPSASDEDVTASLNTDIIRNYEVHLLDEKKMSPRTVGLHMSALSGFCRFLMKEGRLKSNPLTSLPRPKTGKRLPEFYRFDSMKAYLKSTECDALEENLQLIVGKDKTSLDFYRRRLHRLIVVMLYETGMRRAELISLRDNSVDLSRRIIHVHGKGDKMRDIPLLPSLCDEIFLYLKSRAMVADNGGPSEALLLTETGRPLYPVYVDRVIKEALGTVGSITGRKSPHVLRHTLATELLDEGADLNSIKELLGHSSLAATQVYTHNSVERLRHIYESAHPRAKKRR